MAQRAVAKLESPQGRLQGLVLASLASVVLLGKDALARGYAAREVTAALAARDIILGDERLAARLWTLELSLLRVGRRMPAEQLESQVFVLFALLLGQRFESFKLDKGL